jgi:hypothetical protein
VTVPVLHRHRIHADRRRVPAAAHTLALGTAAVALSIAFLLLVADLVERIG